jgi:hypothetical protein
VTKSKFNWRFWATAGAAVGVVGGTVVMASRWMRRLPEPEELERQRRAYVNQVGRVVDGLIVELIEVAAPSEPRQSTRGRAATENNDSDQGHRRLVGYSYSISGVSYETAQDITGLEHRACLERLAAGQAASIKYDPANPSNSILVADDWTGLQ